MSFGLVIQQAIYTKLSNDAPLSAVVSIYDNAPQDGAFPYVTIGEDVLIEWDTDTELGVVGSITLHTWSRERGRKETKTIQGLIYDALHRTTLTSSGYKFVTIDQQEVSTNIDPDGLTRHGIQEFKVILERL